MTTKADKRLAMKKSAVIASVLSGTQAVIKARIAAQGWPPFLVRAVVESAAGIAQTQTDMIAQTPAHLFRTDRPELDPRRVARARRKQGAEVVGINWAVPIDGSVTKGL